ncbi:MAG: PLP-dependent aminotransferase family protein [Acetobacteraceae bacterium]
MWMPSLPTERSEATKHKLITDGIISDIDRGILWPNTRLPTHRELARLLGVSVQTVSISYREAERRGYLRSEVGRGTFVRDRVTERAGQFMLDRTAADVADLSIVRAAYLPAHEDAVRALMIELAGVDNSPWMRPCRPVAGLDRHRLAARAWLARLGVEADADRVLITNGAAHAVFLALATVVRAGDVVLTEHLTDHGVIGLANVLGFSLRGLPTDDHGVLPDAMDAACTGGGVTALVLIPTLGNPTSHIAGDERRRQIAAIARRHHVFVIEDEVCKPLLAVSLPAITAFVPELGFFATSFTKSVMTGLRTGYLVVPPQLSIRAGSILRVTSWSGVPLVAEMAARWVESGVADTLLAAQRREIQARQAIVRDVLGPLVACPRDLSLSAWLPVPRHWTEGALVRALASRGVAVTASAPFLAGSDREADGIRICIGGPMTHARLRAALATIRATFVQQPPVNETESVA